MFMQLLLYMQFGLLRNKHTISLKLSSGFPINTLNTQGGYIQSKSN